MSSSDKTNIEVLKISLVMAKKIFNESKYLSEEFIGGFKCAMDMALDRVENILEERDIK
jgi:hypothetical protein